VKGRRERKKIVSKKKESSGARRETQTKGTETKREKETWCCEEAW